MLRFLQWLKMTDAIQYLSQFSSFYGPSQSKVLGGDTLFPKLIILLNRYNNGDDYLPVHSLRASEKRSLLAVNVKRWSSPQNIRAKKSPVCCYLVSLVMLINNSSQDAMNIYLSLWKRRKNHHSLWVVYGCLYFHHRSFGEKNTL